MPSSSKKTDWNHYYKHPFPTAKILRAITGRRLVRALKKCAGDAASLRRIAEFGGGGSCFAKRLCRAFACESYTVYDSNERSLALFADMELPCARQACLQNILDDIHEPHTADLVFSAGLIEHFVEEDTARAVARHFQLLRKGGLAAFLYPSDTGLYRAVRGLAETLHLWHFPDERALPPDEVPRTASAYGTCLHRECIRSILLTQELLIFRKDRES